MTSVEHTAEPHSGPKSVAIVAFGETRGLAPWDDQSWTIWTMNDGYIHFARSDNPDCVTYLT